MRARRLQRTLNAFAIPATNVAVFPGAGRPASTQMAGKQPLWLSTIMRYYIQPAARRAGIKKKIGWHTFRHTFSTLIKSLGVDAKVVQELLRHASFRTTMDGYTQAMEQPKRQAQEQLADLIMRTGEVGHA
jgi:integrase